MTVLSIVIHGKNYELMNLLIMAEIELSQR